MKLGFDKRSEDGNITIETSYVFFIYVIFLLLMISLMIYIYKDSNNIMILNYNIQKVYEERESAKRKVDMNVKNDFLFGSLIKKFIGDDKMKSRKIENELSKKSKLEEINKIDYKYEWLEKLENA